MSLAKTADEIENLINQWLSRFRGLSDEQAHDKPAPDRWSISEVVGHLIDSACNNHQRFVRAQFLDQFVFPKYEQNQWVEAANYREMNWDGTVNLWYHYNVLIACLIRNLPETKLGVPCTIEPYETCSLEFLATDYLDHLHHHCNILDERISESSELTSE